MNGSAQTLQEWEFDYFNDFSVVVHVCCFAQTCLLQFKYISSALTCVVMELVEVVLYMYI